jgi:hypothetical protein
MPAPDTNLRNFCFAYHGEALKTSILESLHAASAEGVFIEQDGNRYAKISLDRSHGRRPANIPNIITEYNSKMGSLDARSMLLRYHHSRLPSYASRIQDPRRKTLSHAESDRVAKATLLSGQGT